MRRRRFVAPARTHLDELLLGPARAVLHGRLVRALGEELDRGERPHVVLARDRLVLRLVGVHLRDDAGGLGRKRPRNILVRRLHVLAVAAPWRRERHEDVLVLVERNVVKVGGVELDSSGRSRRLDVGLDARLLRHA